MANVPDEPITSDAELEALFAPVAGARGVVLAVSGGPDSTALMLLYARWARRRSVFAKTRVITVDHGLRPEASTEAAAVGRQAEALGLRHAIHVWHGVKPTSDIQSAARAARYRLLEDAAVAEGADVILTGHTLDDQAETFLLALARGSGVYGLAAMPAERHLGPVRLLRPLLATPKSRLIATLRDAGLDWIDDPSNRDDRYARVSMRQFRDDLDAHGLDAATLAATALRLARAADAINIYANRLIATHVRLHPGGFAALDIGAFLSEPDEVALRALSRLMRDLAGADYVPRFERLQRLYADIAAAVRDRTACKRTLCGMITLLPAADSDVDSAARTVWLIPEAGREGFPDIEIAPGETRIWDGRIELTLAVSAAGPLTIRALGPDGRRQLPAAATSGIPALALECMASAWNADRLIAVPAIDHAPGCDIPNCLSQTALAQAQLASPRAAF